MSREAHGEVTLYRCHIGHVLTIETLLHAKHKALEESLGAALAVLNERAELCRQLAEAARERGEQDSTYEEARAQSLERAELVQTLLESDWQRPEA